MKERDNGRPGTERSGPERESAGYDARSSAVSPLRYFRDRLSYVAAFAAALVLSGAALILGQIYYPTRVDMPTVIYAGVLVICCLALWMAVDYLRQRPYFRQLEEASRHAAELDAALRVRSGVTGDQLAVQRLLQMQHEAYMDELGRYRRQQELHQHFVHQWVHQMKTPISVIDLIVQQAGRSEADGSPDSGGDSASIREETEKLTRGLDMMLYTARLDKFELDVQIRSVPLHEIVRRAVNSYKRLCIKYAIYPVIEGDAEVRTDEKWIAFVLGQLIGNAIKYCKLKPGPKKLIARLDKRPGGGTSLHVIDEGIGIPEQDLPRVFDPFFTGSNGRLVEESTGMGLFLAKQVCGKLGHALTVVSRPEGGVDASIGFEIESIYDLGEK